MYSGVNICIFDKILGFKASHIFVLERMQKQFLNENFI